MGTWGGVGAAILAVVGAILPLRGQTPERFSGIDLVVLIDQSGSMWGHPRFHPSKNDRWGHRIGATKNTLLRLLAHVQETAFVHRVSVIDFGDEAKIALPTEVIRFDPRATDLADRIKARIETGVSSKDWINTNTPAAMQLALREFGSMTGAPTTGRRRILLIITDGKALLPGVPADTMHDRVRSEAAALAKQGVEIWLAALNDADNYWNEGEGAFWESITGPGHARLADSASTSLPSVFQNIVDEWLGVKSFLVRGDEYDCPPYLRRIVFNVTYGSPRGEIQIIDPDGRDVARTAGGPSSSPGTFSHFSVDDPKPGTYRIKREPGRSETVHVEEFSPQLERVLPAGAADANVEARILFQARDSAGHPLRAVSAIPIAASLVISSPAGKREEILMKDLGEGRFEAGWTPPAPANYRVNIRGLIRRKDGSTYDVFAHDAHSYNDVLEVTNRKPYFLQLSKPDISSSFRVWPWAEKANIQFVLVDSAGKLVDKPDDLVREPATWLSAQLIDRSGLAVSAPIPLIFGSSGSFTASVPTRLDWMSLEGVTRPGHLSLRVIASAERMTGDSYLNSIQLPRAWEDRRIAGDPFTVGPIEIRLARLGWLTALVIPLAILAILAWFILSRALPNRIINQQDMSKNWAPKIKIYDEIADPSGMNPMHTISVAGRRSFNCDGQVTFSVGGQQVSAERFRVERLNSPSKPKARVEYRWQSGQNASTGSLAAGQPQRLKNLPSPNIVAKLVEK